MINQAATIFESKYKSNPVLISFLRASNLRQLHAAFQHALDAAYAGYRQTAPTLALDDDFVQDAMEFARERLHRLDHKSVSDLNAHFIDQFVKPLTSQLYWTQRSRTHLDEAARCGRSQVYRRYYSSQEAPRPELPPTPQQLPALSTVAYQTDLFRYPLESRSQQRRQAGRAAVPGISAYARGM